MLTGGCFCGRVRYEAAASPFHETICHCADCRRIVGAAAVAWFTVPRAALHFTAETPAGFRSSRCVTRRFCATCGTSLTYERDDLPEEIDVTIASLDDPNGVPPKDHTQASGKLAWDQICDGLPILPGSR